MACLNGLTLGDRFWHVGLQYFKPRRPTFLEVQLQPHTVWDHQVVLPKYDAKGVAICKAMHQGLLSLDLDQAYSVRLYRFIAFDARLPDWKPDRLLTIHPLHKHIEFPEDIPIWHGASAEVTACREKLRKAAEAAAK